MHKRSFANSMIIFVMMTLSSQWSILHAEQIVTWFVHGAFDRATQACLAKQYPDPFDPLVRGTLATFDFPDATPYFWRSHFPAASLAQELEIDTMCYEWQRLNEQYPHADGFILMGTSRGASAIINFVATQHPEKVKALVLESPFDSVNSIIAHRAARMKMPSWCMYGILHMLFWQYCDDGIVPIDHIDAIIDDIPMLFVALADDHSVPCMSTRALYEKRLAAGHAHAHMLVLEQGRHGKLIAGPDSIRYKQVVHEFFKRYNVT